MDYLGNWKNFEGLTFEGLSRFERGFQTPASQSQQTSRVRNKQEQQSHLRKRRSCTRILIDDYYTTNDPIIPTFTIHSKTTRNRRNIHSHYKENSDESSKEEDCDYDLIHKPPLKEFNNPLDDLAIVVFILLLGVALSTLFLFYFSEEVEEFEIKEMETNCLI